MPVFLVHGFRWPRDGLTGIRVHAIVHNLENVSVEYIQNENSRQDILASFRRLYPDAMKVLEAPSGRSLQFIEQYDPDDVAGQDAVSQPYAFVGDRVVVLAAGHQADLCQQFAMSQVLPKSQAKPRVKVQPLTKAPPISTTPNEPTALSVNIEEIVAEGPGATAQAWEALAELRDKIAEEEKIGWWVVYNGDPERAYDEDEELEGEDDEAEEEEERHSSNASSKNEALIGKGKSTSSTQASRQPGSIRAALSALQGRDKPQPSTLPVRGKDFSQETKGEKEEIPEPAKAKELAKEKGIRKKFFGKRP